MIPVAPADARRLLAEGEPGIEMPLRGDGLSVMPTMREPGEERPVAARLKEVLRAGRNSPP